MDEEQWTALRGAFAVTVARWQEKLAEPAKATEGRIMTLMSSVAHLAYHMGAIRQITPSIRGPRATD